MSKNQKSYTKDFKFKVAVEMLKGDLTIPEISAKYQISKSVASKWKNQLLSEGSEVFSKDQKNSSSEAMIEQLHATIGRLKVENDFLQSASRRLML